MDALTRDEIIEFKHKQYLELEMHIKKFDTLFFLFAGILCFGLAFLPSNLDSLFFIFLSGVLLFFSWGRFGEYKSAKFSYEELYE